MAGKGFFAKEDRNNPFTRCCSCADERMSKKKKYKISPRENSLRSYIMYVCVLKIEFEIACLCLQFSAGKSDVHKTT